jgi:peptidoglycan/xylan/chitin deacetylase (PgdA/CDA1 family)
MALRRVTMLAAALGVLGLAACGTSAWPLHGVTRPVVRPRAPGGVQRPAILVVTPPAASPAPSATQSGGSAAPTPATAATAASGCPAAPYGAQHYAPGSGRTVALTFDDGPGGSTAAILAMLARYGVPATFFNIGANMAGRPGIVREEAAAGYVLGDHTWNHPDMARLPAAAQAAELDRTAAEQRALTGTVPCVFRPPYDDYSATTLTLAQQRSMAVWTWSVDTQDWMADGSGSPYWIQRIIGLAESEGGQLPHPVVLMHNQVIGNPATVSALPSIIEFFRSRGYTFVTL